MIEQSIKLVSNLYTVIIDLCGIWFSYKILANAQCQVAITMIRLRNPLLLPLAVTLLPPYSFPWSPALVAHTQPNPTPANYWLMCLHHSASGRKCWITIWPLNTRTEPLSTPLDGHSVSWEHIWVVSAFFLNKCVFLLLLFLMLVSWLFYPLKTLARCSARGFLSAQTCLFSCHWQGIWKKHLHSEQLPQPMPNKPWNVG